MAIVRTKPSEYLVVSDGGKLVNRGTAINLFLWPGTTYVKVPAIQQEARFEMTQETADGIPLRFKGIVIFRVVKPEITVQLFDFSSEQGLNDIRNFISQTCLGELRDKVSHMSMKQCIEERKTTLTDSVTLALQGVVNHPQKDWGVELEVVQVAQVFIVDKELSRQLEAETRNQIEASSNLAEMRAREAVELAELESARRKQQSMLETDRQKAAISKEKFLLETQFERQKLAEKSETDKQFIAKEREKFMLNKQAEQEQIELDKPVQQLRLENQIILLNAEKEMLELERQVQALKVERDMMFERARHELKKDILPLEQRTEIVESVSQMFNGAKLSIYGEDSKLMSTIEPLLGLLGDVIGQSTENRNVAEHKD